MSSDFLSHYCEAELFSFIYAHAQKNIGPAGVAVVAMRDELLTGEPSSLPGFLDYRIQVEAYSNYNTPARLCHLRGFARDALAAR